MRQIGPLGVIEEAISLRSTWMPVIMASCLRRFKGAVVFVRTSHAMDAIDGDLGVAVSLSSIFSLFVMPVFLLQRFHN